MAGPKSSLTFSSLQKYTRKRQLFAKNGFYLAINSTGEVTGTSDESCLYAVLQFLSIGPDLIAIWGLKAKRYLAVDHEGKIYATNFYNIFRTCHSDNDGKGWYLSVDENGKVSAEKVSYSDEPRLHFIVKTLKDRQEENEEKSETTSNTLNNNNNNTRRDKKTKKDFGLPSSEVVWIMQHPYQCDGCMSDIMSSTPSPPSSSCISGSSASTGEWTGSGDNSTSV
ncbi:positive regulation of brown fat cell proliferation [Desmophyllum pertusum]|uniref:Fibroblast growth factor n=1 Tax=Desmophyllum pertusum TaxID=174260 RepID=A0A9X0A4I5_9CNID|nr:positive regulation of brown fat cell proliferation [Desmophyllum pertusum]